MDKRRKDKRTEAFMTNRPVIIREMSPCDPENDSINEDVQQQKAKDPTPLPGSKNAIIGKGISAAPNRDANSRKELLNKYKETKKELAKNGLDGRKAPFKVLYGVDGCI
jgi:hypothetical protein